jgi:two-component system, OmpR family, sensor histidine kinase BaeS
VVDLLYLYYYLLPTFAPLLLVGVAILLIFRKEIFSRLSARIAALIFTSGLTAFVLAQVFNEVTSDTLSPIWLRFLQVGLIVLGGPVVLGLLAARFVRRPLRQFNKAIASLKQSDYQVQLQPTGVREFDEVFSEFNNLIDRLRHEEVLRKDLVSDTSHELNTPLTTMIGQLTAMQEGKHAVTPERIATLKDQAERLADLVKQLEAYTKARTPNTNKQEDIQVRKFCKRLVGHFSSELDEKGMRVKLEITDEFSIRADRHALQQILTNFVQNALRYSNATELSISADKDQLVFSDNGKGVPTESLPYLFERFYRVDKSRNRTTGGLGLGLAIVRELAEQQGWRVYAQSVNPGVAFVLEFKRAS